MDTADEINQAYSRLMAHQFALECITATVLNCLPADAAEQWLADFKSRARRVVVPDNAAVDDIRATIIVRDGAELIENFAEKVRTLLRHT